MAENKIPSWEALVKSNCELTSFPEQGMTCYLPKKGVLPGLTISVEDIQQCVGDISAARTYVSVINDPSKEDSDRLQRLQVATLLIIVAFTNAKPVEYDVQMCRNAVMELFHLNNLNSYRRRDPSDPVYLKYRSLKDFDVELLLLCTINNKVLYEELIKLSHRLFDLQNVWSIEANQAGLCLLSLLHFIRGEFATQSLAVQPMLPEYYENALYNNSVQERNRYLIQGLQNSVETNTQIRCLYNYRHLFKNERERKAMYQVVYNLYQGCPEEEAKANSLGDTSASEDQKIHSKAPTTEKSLKQQISELDPLIRNRKILTLPSDHKEAKDQLTEAVLYYLKAKDFNSVYPCLGRAAKLEYVLEIEENVDDVFIKMYSKFSSEAPAFGQQAESDNLTKILEWWELRDLIIKKSELKGRLFSGFMKICGSCS